MTTQLTHETAVPTTPSTRSTGPDFGRIRTGLLGTWRDVRLAARARTLDPALHQVGDLKVAEHRARVTAQLEALLDGGAVRLPFPEAFGGTGDAGGNLVAFEELVTADPSLQIKAGVQWGLFAAAILHLGTRYHHEHFLADAIELRTFGGFAMTETGHGSDVASIATTAVYDPATEEFVLHTPFRAAWKDYIGNAAVDGRATVVFAQLETLGERHGVHAFFVPIRDEQGAFLQGVGGEDDGQKGGLNGIDNGRLHFTRVRVPRANLLDRYGQVAPDGAYSSPITSPGRRFFTMLGTLVQGRVSLAGAANSGAKVALAIAVKYADERRQFVAGGSDEEVLLDYPRHQRRLLTRLAGVYAATYTQDELLLAFHRVFTGEHDTDESRQDLETFAAAAKAEATWHALDTIQEAREACGGAGFLAENRFGQLHADLDVYTTFEGDNTVLLQLVGKRLLVDYGRKLKAAGPTGAAALVGRGAAEAAIASSGLRGIGQRIADGGTATGAARALRDPLVQERLLEQRVSVAVAEIAPHLRPRQGESPAALSSRFAAHQHALIEAARADARLRQWRAFTAAVERETHAPTRALLTLVRDVFGVQLIERDLGWYLTRRLLGIQRAKAVPRVLDAMLARMRPYAVDLVDAFGYEQGHLRAAIATGAEAARQAEARAAR